MIRAFVAIVRDLVILLRLVVVLEMLLSHVRLLLCDLVAIVFLLLHIISLKLPLLLGRVQSRSLALVVEVAVWAAGDAGASVRACFVELTQFISLGIDCV